MKQKIKKILRNMSLKVFGRFNLLKNEFYCGLCEKTLYKNKIFLFNKLFSKIFKKLDIPLLEKHRGRKNAICSNCKSLERHRFAKYILSRTNIDFKGSCLHIAPEKTVENSLKKIFNIYKSCDIEEGKAEYICDITQKTPFKNEEFDFVYCSHVMEHIREDDKAYDELYRILKKSGYMLIMVPISEKYHTCNKYDIDDENRKKFYGQEDHVRKYGLDIIDKIEKHGFKVNQFKVDMSNFEHKIRGFKHKEMLFICHKEGV